MDKIAAIRQMNEWGRSNTAFLFIVDFELQNIQMWSADNIPDFILYQLGSFSNFNTYAPAVDDHLITAVKPFPRSQYLEAFNLVQDELNYGNSFLLNLTFRSEIISSCQLEEFFFISNAKYKICYKDQFVFFSPESFVQIKDGIISSFPMKGTIDAELENAASIILNDPKEKAEHNTIVDLIRNDISRFAQNVRVPRFRYIDKIQTRDKSLLQVSSEVRGDLKPGYREKLGDILFSLLPAGSISGAPKTKTLEIIRNIEKIPRGYYTGVAGYFDGNSLDSCVMIRFIEKEKNKYYYRSGGGITFMSDANTEYRELLQKIYVPTH